MPLLVLSLTLNLNVNLTSFCSEKICYKNTEETAYDLKWCGTGPHLVVGVAGEERGPESGGGGHLVGDDGVATTGSEWLF